jgi:hypothetical protein
MQNSKLEFRTSRLENEVGVCPELHKFAFAAVKFVF